MRTLAAIVSACALLAVAPVGAQDKGLAVKGIRFFSYPNFTRIVFETETAAPYVMTRSGDGRSIYFSSYGGPFVLSVPQLPVINDGVVKGLESRQEGSSRAVIISLTPAAGEVKDFVLRGPDRIVLDVFRGTQARHAPEAASGKQVVVMVDPGHGGRDLGVVTGQGLEKAVTLDLAKALRRALRRSDLPLHVLLTREQDQQVDVNDRPAAANAAEAQVFISLHLAPGQESRVYLLDPDEGRSVATSAAPADFLGFDAAAGQQQAWGTQQAGFAQESGRLGRAVVRSLTGRPAAEPDQAPLLALKPVAAAAVLIEVAAEQDRSQVVEAIARGIEQYVRERR